MRLAYFCMRSEFSMRPLAALLEAGYDIQLVVRPFARDYRNEHVLEAFERPADDDFSSLDESDPFRLALPREIPCYRVGDASSSSMAKLLRDREIDLVIVAFFNQLLKPRILERLPMGAINIHPSLLPKYRGPAPLFWTFRNGEQETGVTVHRIAAGEDTGDILQQERARLPFGTKGEALIPLLGAQAACALLDVLAAQKNGSLVPRAQDDGQATRATRPDKENCRLDTSMPASRLYSFVRGVGRWHPLYVELGGESHRVLDALEWSCEESLPVDWVLLGDVLHLRCVDGRVAFRTAQPE